MKKILLFLASSLMLFASCAKEDSKVEPSPVDPKPEGELIYSVTVSLGDSTKATLGEPEGESGKMFRKVTWNTGDQICVNGSVSDELDAEYDGKETATFTFSSPISGSAPYIACYPASVYKNATHVTLPAVQGDAEGANKAIAFPMVGQAADAEGLHTISLKQLCGFIRVKVQGNLTLSKMSFTGNNGEQVSGEFELGWTGESGDEPTLTAKKTPDAADKTVSVSSNATLALGTDKYCVIAVPANTYSKGAKLSFSTSGNTFDVNSPSSKTIDRASVKNISTISVVEIASADAWNTFAGDFNDNKYPNEGSSTFVNFTSDLDFSGKDITTITKDFKGTILGNDKKLTNVNLSNSLISKANLALISNLTIQGTANFSVSTTVGDPQYFGVFVGNNWYSTISNCVSEVSISATCTAEPKKNILLGGIAGSNGGGKILQCKNNGAINIGDTFTVGSTNIYIGGICGLQSGADALLENCFNGNGKESSGEATITYSGTAGRAYIGGIAGSHSNGYFHCCINDCALVVNSANTASEYVGGVAGHVQSIRFGDADENNINRCRNSITVSNALNLYCGGLYGNIYHSENKLILVHSKANPFSTGNISVSNLRSNATEVCVGGLIGRVDALFEFTLSGNMQMNRTVSVSLPNDTYTATTLRVGGIIGSATKEISISGKSDATLTDGGKPTVTMVSSKGCSISEGSVGGILGGANDAVSIKYCTTSANSVGTTTTYGTKTNGKIFNVGGIAGYVKGGSNNSSINNCTVTSMSINNYHYNNNAVSATAGNCTGGIIGSFGHSSNNTATLTISNCSNAAPIYAFRCCGGGIGGFLDHATVKGCSVTGAISAINVGKNTYGASYVGGLVGYASNCTFGGENTDACTFNCSNGIYSTTGGSCYNYAGGLAGQTVACSFTNCGSYFGTTLGINAAGVSGSGNAPGSLIGYSDANTTVASCKAGGKMQSANYGMPGASGTTSATLDETTVLTYAVGNKAFTPTSGSVTLWDGQ